MRLAGTAKGSMLGTDGADNLEEHQAYDSGVDCVTECHGLSESIFPTGASLRAPAQVCVWGRVGGGGVVCVCV